jgi:hypothetical protein
MWPFKPRTSQVPDDIGEAQELRRVATAQLAAVEKRTNTVNQIGQFLAERREQNHFGEAIQITFTRRAS